MADATTVTSLLPFQQEALQDLWKRTTTQVDQGLPIYQGARVAPLSEAQLGGIQQMKDYAASPQATQGIGTAIDANTFWADPSRVYDLSSIPGYAASRAGIESSVGRMLTEQALPQIRGSAILNNQLGNSRVGLAEGEAVRKSTEALTAGLGNLDLNTAMQILQANQAAIGRAPSLVAAGTIPANINLQAGGIEQNQAQALIDADRQQFEETANAPYFGLDQLRASLGQFPGGTGKTTQNQADASWWETLAALGLLGQSTGLFGGGNKDWDFPGFGD